MAGIGDYKPVKLIHYTTTVDANGDASQTAQTWTLWAEVTDLGGGRSQVDGRTTLSDGKEFKIWFREEWALNGDWKVRYFGQTYAITGLTRVNEKRFNWLIRANVQS
jgi:hypothetical protein